MKADLQFFDGGLPSMFPDLEVHECARYYADANKLPFSRMNLDVFERLFNIRSVQDVLSSDVLDDDGKHSLLNSIEKAKQTNKPLGVGTQNINGALVNPTPEWIKQNRKCVRVRHGFGVKPEIIKIGDGNFEDPSLANRGVSFSISPKGQLVLDVDMVDMMSPEGYSTLMNQVKTSFQALQLIHNSVDEVDMTTKKERRAYQQALARDDDPRGGDRRHRGTPAHIGRLSPPLPTCLHTNLSNSLLSVNGGDLPPTQNWTVGLRVLGMKLLAMGLLGPAYGEEGQTKRFRYGKDMFQDVCGDPTKRAKLHPTFATMHLYDAGGSLMCAAAQVRSTDLMKDPLWPYVWCKVWDRLFEIQDEARQEALDSLAKARLEKKLLRRKNALARKDAVGNSLPDQPYAELVWIHDKREAAEREEAKATKELRSRVAEDKERRLNAQALSTPLPPPLRHRKKKTAVVLSGVEASKRERAKAESLERSRVAEANRRKKEAEMAAEDAVREEFVKIGFCIQCGN